MEDDQITDNDKEDDKQDRIELVQRAVEGDKEAFTNLYMLTYSEVYHIVKVLYIMKIPHRILYRKPTIKACERSNS